MEHILKQLTLIESRLDKIESRVQIIENNTNNQKKK